jgi:outer membrane receptor protein involved in Fe transport
MAQDSSNVQSTEPAWRGALTWQFLPNQAIRYSYARSFRIPSLIETEILWSGAFNFGRRDEPQSAYPISVPLPLETDSVRLKPETIDSHSIGYFGTFFGSSATLDLKVFSETIHDPIESFIFYFSPPPFNSSPFTVKGAELEAGYRISDHWKVSGQYSYLDNTALDPLELELQSRNAGSVLITYQPLPNHALSVAYYGNSDMAGHDYDRFDFVYNYNRTLGTHLLRSKFIWQHHFTPGEGLRDPNPLLSNEGYFAHVDQVFLNLEFTF